MEKHKRMNRAEIEAIASEARAKLTEAGAGLVIIVVADEDNHGIMGGCTGIPLDVMAEAAGTFVLSLVGKVIAKNGRAAAMQFLEVFLEQLQRHYGSDGSGRTSCAKTDMDADFTDVPLVSKAVH